MRVCVNMCACICICIHTMRNQRDACMCVCVCSLPTYPLLTEICVCMCVCVCVYLHIHTPDKSNTLHLTNFNAHSWFCEPMHTDMNVHILTQILAYLLECAHTYANACTQADLKTMTDQIKQLEKARAAAQCVYTPRRNGHLKVGHVCACECVCVCVCVHASGPFAESVHVCVCVCVCSFRC
jgi:hypothetical protein